MAIMTRHVLPLFLGGAAFLASDVQADTRAAVEGAGSMTCQQVRDTRDAADPRAFNAAAHWVFGYLTAAGGYLDDTFDLTPWQSPDTIMAQILQFCDENPDARLVAATVAYIDYLHPQRLTAPSDIVELRQDDGAVRIYADLIPQIQDRLVRLGFHDGTPSGTFDPATADAIRALQVGAGLPVTGLPDGRTLVHIFR